MAKPTDNDIKPPPAGCSTWTEVEANINGLAAENPNLAQNTVENARRLARFAAERYQTPGEIGLGYWPTIRLSWSSPVPPIEIEIFQNHYEFYRFAEGATDIQHVPTTKDTFPEALKMILDATIPRKPVVEIDS